MLCVIIIIAIIVIIRLIKKTKTNANTNTKTKTEITPINTTNYKPNYETSHKTEIIPYRKNDFIFSRNEYACYKNLKIIADKYNLEIFAKVRMADIVSVDRYQTYEFQKYFNKIKSKHIDFVLLDNKYMQPKLLIELDDNSHNRPDRIDRDAFVDSVFQKCNLPIIHIKNYTLEILENDIKNKIVQNMSTNTNNK